MPIRRIAAITQHEMATALCPYCGAELDYVTGVEYDTTRCPKIAAGELSLCGECLEVMRFDGRIYQRVSAAETADYLEKNELMRDFREMERADKLREELTSKTGKRREATN